MEKEVTWYCVRWWSSFYLVWNQLLSWVMTAEHWRWYMWYVILFLSSVKVHLNPHLLVQNQLWPDFSHFSGVFYWCCWRCSGVFIFKFEQISGVSGVAETAVWDALKQLLLTYNYTIDWKKLESVFPMRSLHF